MSGIGRNDGFGPLVPDAVRFGTAWGLAGVGGGGHGPPRGGMPAVGWRTVSIKVRGLAVPKP